MEQLDKLDQYTTPATEGVTAEDGELGELSQKFYQAAVQVCVCVYVLCMCDCETEQKREVVKKKRKTIPRVHDKVKGFGLVKGKKTLNERSSCFEFSI